MISIEDDRRKHRRAYFAISNNVMGHFILSGKPETEFKASILNISVGGLHFTMDKSHGISPLTGDKLRLVKIKGEAALDFEFNSEIKVEWILGHESVPHISCGCEFIDMPKPGLDQISGFIDSKYISKTV